ncbi:hypothetical protein GSI_00623 [Ganoderma sinense ZZ0214-1]|uniref:Uncharacterized protein n=1 Tax=Ganoderma sinense ZZ0214-1 TaxID=1077348 RepID=A0A2G8ST98_9APHY|nr:hypothetical protein GSI_00623 [Ganoderma sinense ZZ0214-1]
MESLDRVMLAHKRSSFRSFTCTETHIATNHLNTAKKFGGRVFSVNYRYVPVDSSWGRNLTLGPGRVRSKMCWQLDIIPPHGSIHKPSTLWLVHPKPEGGYTRVIPTRTKPPPQPGRADKLKPPIQEAGESASNRVLTPALFGTRGCPGGPEIPTQTEMQQAQDDVDVPVGHDDYSASTTEARPTDAEPQGDCECLKDEIIYLAHKAANPKVYPENGEKFHTPTKVHLQVFDDLCHVLTVFTFTEPGEYAYRWIADFVKHVIDCPEEGLRCHGSSDLDKSSSQDHKQDDVQVHPSNVPEAEDNVNTGPAATGSRQELQVSNCVGDKSAEPIIFIRERVNPLGKVRPMEPPDQLLALRIPPSEIGLIKEGPVRRWLAGQEAWDKRF